MLWQRGKSYSQDLRERVFAAADDGEPVGQIARLLRVSVSYVSKVLSRRQRTGQTQALPQRGHVPPKLADLHGAIQTQVTARPDATIEELRAWLSKTHQVSASTGLMWKTLAALDLTLKNVWPAPSASDFVTQSDQSTPTYPVTGHSPGQDGDPHVPVLIKVSASERHF
jgi:transposase